VDPRFYKQVYQIEQTHWWFAARRRILLAVLDRLAIGADSVLDIGCGAGTNLDLLSERFAGGSVHGIDIEIEALRFCRSERPTPVYAADFANLPFRADSFDLIFALDSLEHVADDVSALQGAHRVCRPGGTLVITVPAFGFLWGSVDTVGHHFRRYGRRELEQKVAAAGFSLRYVRYFNTLLFPPILAFRLLARLTPKRDETRAERVHTDFDVISRGPLNTLLTRIFSLEAALLRFEPPFGVSLLCVAVRKD
jgi:SAM-dependent methyltransferase